MIGRFALAAVASAVVVMAAPFMGQLQSALRAALTTGQYVTLVGGAVATAIVVTILFAITRIRERRGARFGTMALALAFGVAYTTVSSTGYAEVDAVERVHFIEYGLIAFLFYRVWQSAGDVSIVVLPMLCGLMVGTLDEWLQWFVPGRVGEAHDVFLNLASIGCGLMFGIAMSPPPSFAWRPSPRTSARMGVTAAIAWLVFATFVSQVHLGYAIDIEGGRFSSHYDRDQLAALQRDRAARWQVSPPRTLRRLSREDQYLDEGFWHVRRRNVLWGDGEVSAAWHENLILEQFYAPVLDAHTYASPEGNRWPPDHRADATARRAPIAGGVVSAAEPYPIVTWPKGLFWSSVGIVALLLGGLPLAVRRRGASS